jgi:signal transduction histidine kinase
VSIRPNKLEFRISTGLKNIIGKELITDDYIAIFELVKNSYDADASTVKIVFENMLSTSPEITPKILIIDDGVGMSYEDIIHKWLFVGFSEKKITKSSDFRDKITKRKRIFAGAKGIGRFSADRLGVFLSLYTRKHGETHFHGLYVDWSKFEADQEEEFQRVDVDYRELPTIPSDRPDLKNFEHGTVLEISMLRENWDRKKLLKLKRYLQRLINPSEEFHHQRFKIQLEAKEYLDEDEGKEDYDRINGPIQNVVFEKINMKTTQIRCQVTQENIVTELNDKGRFVFRFQEKNEYPELHDIQMRVFFLNEEAKTAFSKAMGIQPKSFGSIFLYKNGFRIQPYGNEDNDWLGLDRRKTQGYARFLGNRDLIGRTEVYGFQPGFQEVSSRAGGVTESEALRQLKEMFIEKVLRRLELYVIEAIYFDTDDIEKKRSPEQIKAGSINLIQKIVGSAKDPDKTVTFNKDLLTIFKERQFEKIPELVRNVEQLTKHVKSRETRRYIQKQLQAVKRDSARLESEVKQTKKELAVKERQALFLMDEISTDVEAVNNLKHTIKLATIAIENILDDIFRKIREGATLKDILPDIDDISLENKQARLLAEISTRANFDPKADWINEDLVFYIKQYVERILGRRKGPTIRYRFLGEEVSFTKRFRTSSIIIVLNNFIDNSIKHHARTITFSFRVKDKSLHVYVADDGDGVPVRAEKHLFTRGFSTTDGSGIGLHHVKSLVRAMGAEVSFVGNNFNNLGKGACFEMVFK